jgi:hypothetical protein
MQANRKKVDYEEPQSKVRIKEKTLMKMLIYMILKDLKIK